MLDIDGITKRYGDVDAVDDVSLEVRDGELFSILGPSGSGKSTLLGCIAGLEFPDAGLIRLDGEDITDQRAYNRDTATVFQSLALFPHMSVEENIEYGMKQHGVGKEKREKRTREYLELVDLEGYNTRSIDELSGGEQQRVALVRSLVVQPKVVLLDEALGSLDQVLRMQLQDELYELQRQLDQTMVYVTHDQNVAFSISDRVAVMNNGQVEQIGTPEELYEAPKTPFIAQFVGNSNSIHATIEQKNGTSVEAVIPGSRTGLKGTTTETEIGEGSEVTVVIKIDDITVGSPDGEDNVFEGTVINKKYRGENSKLLVKALDDLRLEVLVDEYESYDVGDAVQVSWSRDDCLIFAETSAPVPA